MERVLRRKGKKNAKSRLAVLIAGLAFVLLLVLCLVIKKTIDKDKEQYISKALAARMLVLLKSDSPPAAKEENPGNWYVKYMDYLYRNGEIEWTVSEKTGEESEHRFGTTAGAQAAYARPENAYKALTYGELRSYLSANGWNVRDIGEYTDIKLEKIKGGKKVNKDDFSKIYDYLVLKTGSVSGVIRREITIIGTPASMTARQIGEYGQWNCVSLEGSFCFEGLSMDAYCDRTICVYTRGNQIISVLTEVTDEVEYPNIWITAAGGNTVTAYISGVYREFTVGDISGSLTDIVGDIDMKGGKIQSLTVKKDTISGKVLKVGNDALEIEGYGSVPIGDNFRVYKNYGELEERSLNDILVGYALSDFVVADGKICAAVINKELIADDIRVLIMNTGYESIFHDRVTFTSQDGFSIRKGDELIHVEPGQLVDIYFESDYMSEGRIILEPDGINNGITLLSVERSYGNPSYTGTLEISVEQNKLVVINELPLEEYLYRVVPSEMPVRFGVEALKVQAVCARSYAYRHLIDNSYRMYGAHVDDSVNYQVYNNIEAQPDSTQAVKETYGQVISKDGNVTAAYYYSTSCGAMSDISLWGGNPEQYNMYVSKTVNPSGRYVDLSDEETFREFIYGRNETDFDYEFPFYRWDVELSTDYLTQRVNDYLRIRHDAEPENILMMDSEGNYAAADDPYVGRILSLEVAERCSGGAIRQLLVHGAEGDALVRGELNIRYILGPGDNLINTNTENTTTFYVLPSAYVYPEEIYEDGGLVGWRFVGGGYGHGIGMSQNAVSSMVKRGMRYDEIIDFFYENVDIINIYH